MQIPQALSGTLMTHHLNGIQLFVNMLMYSPYYDTLFFKSVINVAKTFSVTYFRRFFFSHFLKLFAQLVLFFVYGINLHSSTNNKGNTQLRCRCSQLSDAPFPGHRVVSAGALPAASQRSRNNREKNMHFTYRSCRMVYVCVCAHRTHFPETNGNQRKNKVVKHSERKIDFPCCRRKQEKHTGLLVLLRARFYCLLPVIGQFGAKTGANCAGRCERKDRGAQLFQLWSTVEGGGKLSSAKLFVVILLKVELLKQLLKHALKVVCKCVLELHFPITFLYLDKKIKPASELLLAVL